MTSAAKTGLYVCGVALIALTLVWMTSNPGAPEPIGGGAEAPAIPAADATEPRAGIKPVPFDPRKIEGFAIPRPDDPGMKKIEIKTQPPAERTPMPLITTVNPGGAPTPSPTADPRAPAGGAGNAPAAPAAPAAGAPAPAH
jgi:hypothetical protein